MKRKLVLKAEKLRVLTETRLERIVGGAPSAGNLDPSAMETGCSCQFSQAAICDICGGKG